jgi:hypothetical protein
MSDATHGGKGDRDRTSNKEAFWRNYEKVFGKRDAPVEISEKPLTQVQIDRKLREWGMMYDCLQNLSLYDYPIEEAKELLKQIKIS